MTDRIYVIGAGLAGLSASVALAEKGIAVDLIEAAGQAGGRCRSYFDPVLGQTIDNGNHLVLSGNHATMRYVSAIGAREALAGPDHARADFLDLNSGERWAILPDDGPIPFWLFDPKRRVPATRPGDYFSLAKLFVAGADRAIGEVLRCEGPLWRKLLQPFFLSALNTQPELGSAALAARLVRETFAKGGRAYCPRIAHPTLAAAFVDPALRYLEQKGTRIRLSQRLRRIEHDGEIVGAIETTERTITLSRRDRLILATPAWTSAELLPEINAPDEFSAIVNAHFRFAPPPGTPAMLGLIGGTAEWVFSFSDRVSVTVSGADRLIDVGREELAQRLWRDVAKALGVPDVLPPWQIVKEKRATFAATPAQNRRRSGSKTRWRNLFLAGDWTDTGLPATIEGAIRSGQKAAALALGATPL